LKGFINRVLRAESWFKTLKLDPMDRYIDFEIRLKFSFEQGKKYQYSKLYYNYHSTQQFHESRVICFQPLYRGVFERVRILLPESVVNSGFMSIRIDGVPYSEGKFDIKHVHIVDGRADPHLTQLANWSNNQQAVRKQVLESEEGSLGLLPHYPESVSLELTPRCNLRCPHCSSHGTRELHKAHNARPEMSPHLFEKIAHELFPHITTLSLVGRGEPTMVSHALWAQCVKLVKLYGVKISCVTNGHFIKQRFTEDFLPYIDELCISIDGNSPEIHHTNRGGSSLIKVLENIAHFHNLRKNAQLARRPKLSFYWTLMTNNVDELAEFIRAAEKFQPDYYAIRHLVVFHDKDRELSLLGQPERTNLYLKEAYEELNRQGINFEAPPLMDESKNINRLPENIIAREPSNYQERTCDSLKSIDPNYLSEQCTWMYRTGIISYNGEVTTCGKHYGELVGALDHDNSFNDVWNGMAMQSLRTSFNTPKMWQQCKECWLRELRWHSQRHTEGFDNHFLDERASYTRAAWDYRAYSDL
jgi:radical SAM protein with 4Fe4S-binding SPASM domain